MKWMVDYENYSWNQWCWIFSLPVGMFDVTFFEFIGDYAWVNALSAGWISFGNIWMFGGLLVMMKKAKKERMSI